METILNYGACLAGGIGVMILFGAINVLVVYLKTHHNPTETEFIQDWNDPQGKWRGFYK